MVMLRVYVHVYLKDFTFSTSAPWTLNEDSRRIEDSGDTTFPESNSDTFL